jgi:hypothetical protein
MQNDRKCLVCGLMFRTVGHRERNRPAIYEVRITLFLSTQQRNVELEASRYLENCSVRLMQRKRRKIRHSK